MIPELAVTMDHPWADPDLRAGSNGFTHNGVVNNRLACDMCDGRIKAHRFEQRLVQSWPIVKVFELGYALRRIGFDLNAQSGLLGRVEREQIDRPE